MLTTRLHFSAILLVFIYFTDATKVKVIPNGSKTTHKDGVTHEVSKYIIMPDNPNIVYANDDSQAQVVGRKATEIDVDNSNITVPKETLAYQPYQTKLDTSIETINKNEFDILSYDSNLADVETTDGKMNDNDLFGNSGDRTEQSNGLIVEKGSIIDKFKANKQIMEQDDDTHNEKNLVTNGKMDIASGEVVPELPLYGRSSKTFDSQSISEKKIGVNPGIDRDSATRKYYNNLMNTDFDTSYPEFVSDAENANANNERYPQYGTNLPFVRTDQKDLRYNGLDYTWEPDTTAVKTETGNTGDYGDLMRTSYDYFYIDELDGAHHQRSSNERNDERNFRTPVELQVSKSGQTISTGSNTINAAAGPNTIDTGSNTINSINSGFDTYEKDAFDATKNNVKSENYISSKHISSQASQANTINYIDDLATNSNKYATDSNVLKYNLSQEQSNALNEQYANSFVIINGERHAMDSDILNYILSHKQSNTLNEQFANSYAIINGEKHAIDSDILTFILSHYKQSNTVNKKYTNNVVIINGKRHDVDSEMLKYILSHKQSNTFNKQYVNSFAIINGQKHPINDDILKYILSRKKSRAVNEQYTNNIVIINGKKHDIDSEMLQYILSHKQSNALNEQYVNSFAIINGQKHAINDDILTYILSRKQSNTVNEQYAIINGEKHVIDNIVLKYVLSHKGSNTLNEQYVNSFVIINGQKYAIDDNVLKYILSLKHSNALNKKYIKEFKESDIGKTKQEYIIQNEYMNDESVNNYEQEIDKKLQVSKYTLNKTPGKSWRARLINIYSTPETNNQAEQYIIENRHNRVKYDNSNEKLVHVNLNKDINFGTNIIHFDNNESNNAHVNNFNKIIIESDSNYDFNVDMERKTTIERKYNLAKLKEFLQKIVVQTKVDTIENMNLLYNNALNYIVLLDSRGISEKIIAKLIRNIHQQVLKSVKIIYKQNRQNRYKKYKNINRPNLCMICQQRQNI